MPPVRTKFGHVLARLACDPAFMTRGQKNAITDVEGVLVGQVTIVEGENVRTGVTAILPHKGNLFQDKVAEAVYVYNGFGKLTGSTQVAELGQIETPVVLTNTLSVWDVASLLLHGRWLSPATKKCAVSIHSLAKPTMAIGSMIFVDFM